jgi:hypothetical protein
VHPEIRSMMGNERQAELLREAAVARIAREARRRNREVTRPADDARVTLRLDRVGDGKRLRELADLSCRTLTNGALVVAETEGRLVAALPVSGGLALTDPFEPTAHVVPLLELRAAQIRRAGLTSRRRFRLLPRRA